ncbi:aspartate-semialdehyde dehydrogenase [Deferribacter desulfuricans SSM1]|uniref:Aspartate-semialdehyde dehydrogenase n=1 Tax=Deferribacter desulfuricans (strain DSM 14783 / JCM 11476 / NBRC 101012 / SSM1) TaxID=639282 RepID=D3PE56_DEFDS|nr:aspartate-semialdehyde dehydrogenase [Deferribacter desulfuricans]BAI80879.1 aspartate-semialdehyde dehydrogenase [Deferribacter desulfuricans SSM1]
MALQKKEKYNVAIVGATGAVGQVFLQILEERNFPIDELRLLASSRSAGKKVKFKGEEYTVQELTHDSFEGIDIALFSAGGGRSKEFAPSAVKAGAVVIDNSSAFRMDKDVPLVVPEVNPDDAFKHNGIIANPNCTTIIMVVALKPLHNYGKIRRVVVSSYQSASGAGAKAMQELMDQTKAWANGEPLKVEAFQHQLLFNVIPHIDVFMENGYTREEMKMYNETKKIMGDDSIEVTATCVRVPVLTAHSEAVTVETEKKITVEKAKELFSNAQGIQVLDNPEKNEYPMPLFVSGKDDCYVGRIREDISKENSLNFWVVGDQLRKGAALNAVQIAELLISK